MAEETMAQVRAPQEGELREWAKAILTDEGCSPKATANLLLAADAEIDRLEAENSRLRRCLFPVMMTMAEAEACDQPYADSAVILQFMGSGGSDMVTAGAIRAALKGEAA